jgi:hypothetical protein
MMIIPLVAILIASMTYILLLLDRQQIHYLKTKRDEYINDDYGREVYISLLLDP